MKTLRAASCVAVVALALLSEPASAEQVKRVVVISPKEAKAKGLFAVGVSVDISAGNLTPTKFPSKDFYLVASGPPGGPLGLDIRKGSLVKDCVREPLPSAVWHPKRDAKIKVGRRRLKASAYTDGKSLARHHGCSVALRRPGALLLLRFWSAAGTTEHPGCAALAKQSPFNTILPSIRLIKK
jgi:hypothetical protein